MASSTPPTTAEASPALEALPVEIIACIVKFAEASGPNVLLVLHGVNKELSNKTFERYCKAYFTERTVNFFKNSLTRLFDFSINPDIRRFVKTIIMTPHRLLSAQEIKTRHYRVQRGNATRIFETDALRTEVICQLNENSDGVRHVPDDQDTINKAANYVKLFHQQTEMEASGKDVAMLAEAMTRLPSLNAIELQDSNSRSRHTIRYGGFDFKQQGFASTDAMLDSCCGPKGTTVATHAFSKTIAAIALARSLLPTFRIERFEDRIWGDRRYNRPTNVLIGSVQLPQLTTPLAQALFTLKKLELRFSPHGGHKIAQNSTILSILQVFWCGAGLQEFTLDFSDVDDQLVVGPKVSKKCLHRLSTLARSTSLRRFSLKCGDFSSMDMVRFVSEHASTLERLILDDVWLEKGGSIRLWTTLRTCSALRYLEFDTEYNFGGGGVYRTQDGVKAGIEHLIGKGHTLNED